MNLIDSRGNPINNTKVAKAAFFVSIDGEEWRLIKPDQVPEQIANDKDIMGYLMAGEIIQKGFDGPFYRAERLN